MAGDTTVEVDGGGELDLGVEGFEIAGLADAEGDGLVFLGGTGKGAEIVPGHQPIGVLDGGDCGAVVLGVLD